MDLWVVMVTDGTVIEYPPEVYGSREAALDEAARWANWLARGDESIIEHLDGTRWSVRDVDVRLVAVTTDTLGSDRTPWVGTYWTTDGPPDPEAVLFSDRRTAHNWIMEPPPGLAEAVRVHEDEWLLTATYLDRGEEAYAVAHRAKVVGTPPRPDEDCGGMRRQVEYEVEVTASLLQRMRSSLFGPPGLSKEQIEDLVELNWAAISANVAENLDISWELESFRLR